MAETTIDLVLKEVKSKGAVKAKELSKKFNVEEGVIDEWASILEKNGLVTVEYPMSGGAVLINKAKDKEDVHSRKPKISRTPNIVILGILAIVLAVVVANYMGLLEFEVPEGAKIPTPSISQRGSTTEEVTYIPIKILDPRNTSIIYTVSIEYCARGREDYRVFIDHGKIRVNYPGSEEYLVYDGQSYYFVYADNQTPEEMSKELFEAEADELLPWTYIERLGENLIAGPETTVDGRNCTQTLLANGDVICILINEGLPLKYRSEDRSLVFRNIELDATINDNLFIV